ncbi:uncharacterized protein LOC115989013 [Quercus lobata]|uniref:uncharacterized protein LOC115989013 n=1 Tax=Quercus lobata TaxID=97700 RepID=UPI0012494AB0|nr:uncharacterized protein LOC115989013 [Quercus lobata]
MVKAPKNVTYTSLQIQKEILHVISTKVKKVIREEIGDAKFCILVDKARDESMKEQMAVVLRYVDTNGFMRERFFGIVHVIDTAAGQGYDGASNMQGEWNGLQALILNDCPYAYYIHCFAHRLQLALVGALKAVVPLNRFFTKLILVINNIRASCKHIEQLKIARASNIAYLIDIEELEIGKGLNQMVTLQRPGDTRWDNFYPIDFTDDEKNDLKKELDLYKVVKLVLTLSVSTATTERAFSAMNVIKTDLCNKMEDEFLSDTMIFIERDIVATISTDSIIDDFEDLKRRRVPFS